MRYLILLIAAFAAFAQPRLTNTYTATCPLSLSSAAGACTVQQPASNARNVQFVGAYVKCSVACALTQERNGTAATATAVTVRKTNPEAQDSARATAFTSSDVGVGTLITDAGAITLAAGEWTTINLEDIQMRSAGTNINYTIRTGTMTGDVKIVIRWREY